MNDEGTENREQGSGPTKSGWGKFIGPALILLSALVATLPQMWRGPSCGHDFDFHLVSWIDAQHSWRQGILYPQWTPSPNFEAGEPRFIFYPPLTWMFGAVLGTIIPWKFVPAALLVLLFAATGVATRALARQAFDDGVATLAGCAAIFSGYALFTAYERSAFAEMTGGFWVPLLLMLILRGSEEKQKLRAPSFRLLSVERVGDYGSRHPRSIPAFLFDRTTLLIALVIAGAWLSNAPLGVMLSYLLAGISFTVALLVRSWVPVIRAAFAAFLGLALSAFFWIPAAREQSWVAIRQAVDDPGLLIENSWLFARHADPRLELHDVELIRVSAIGVTMVAVALAGVGVAWFRRLLPADRRWWVPLALVPVVVLFLLLPISDFVWNALPKMRFLQFPWRWLVVLEAPMAIFFAAAVWPRRRRIWRVLVSGACCGIFVAATAFALVSMYQGCDEDDEVSGILRDYQTASGVEGTDEYAPPNADDSLVSTGLPFACLVKDPNIPLGNGDPDATPEWTSEQGSCDTTFADTRGSSEHRRLQADIPHAGYLVLRLRTYPAWRVSVNGQPVSGMPPRQDGLMAVPVPEGRINIAADWTTTGDVLTARLVSLAALALTAVLWLPTRRRIVAQVS
jgi:hypothetical protein